MRGLRLVFWGAATILLMKARPCSRAAVQCGALLLAALIAAGTDPVFAAGNPSPLSPTAIFQDPDGTAGDQFGGHVALSADGSEALISAGGATVDGVVSAGKAYIYTETDGGWSANPVATFLDPTLQFSDMFGGGVALSADGSVALISSGSPAGADNFVYVYSKTNGAWSTAPVATLTDPDPGDGDTYGDAFGCPTLSADGNTALIGAGDATVNGVTGVGKAYIFTQTGGVWSDTPVATFIDPGNVKDDFFGCGALNADGTVAIITTLHLFGPGRTFIFTQTNGSWNTTPVAVLTAGQSANGANARAALSGGGDVALLGVGNDNSYAGAAYIYMASSGVWPTSPAITLTNPAPSTDGFGLDAVALSSDGTVAALNGLTFVDGVEAGAIDLYTETGSTWVNAPAAVIADPEAGQNHYLDYFGYTAALSANGKVLVVGAPAFVQPAVGDPGGPGTAYIYNEPANGWSSPVPAPPPATLSPPSSSAGGSGGGALGMLSLLAFLSLVSCRKRLNARQR